MPYLAFDLDAFGRAPNVARAGGIPEDTAIAGLGRMWLHCWREKTDQVDSVLIRGFFGADLADILATFGFVVPREGGFRVKGAERYLRIHKAQSEAGKKASANLRRGHLRAVTDPEIQLPPEPTESRGQSRSRPPAEPELTSGSGPALTSSIEHRASNSEQVVKKPPARPQSEAIAAFQKLEAQRVERFGGIEQPPPPSWEAEWPRILEKHAGDQEWVGQTFENFCQDPWASRLKPPGALQAFAKPDQWPRHVRPRVEAPEASQGPCFECGGETSFRMPRDYLPSGKFDFDSPMVWRHAGCDPLARAKAPEVGIREEVR